MINFANPKPEIYNIEFDSTLTPGLYAVTVTVNGNYFTPTTEIYVRDNPQTVFLEL